MNSVILYDSTAEDDEDFSFYESDEDIDGIMDTDDEYRDGQDYDEDRGDN